eukprot:TRINITY_DN18344_c0_g1_i3.p2 TRINITY_DN18344_c0_g1~~TRINITY_DN18344_c0_g1_i3.p2  ORF type:complete len:188 (+),score=30.59 TRINITY_DN18344_c0_g1_i3:277-840(+)
MPKLATPEGSTDISAWKGGPSAMWTYVREDEVSSHCAAGHTSMHVGWPEATRYVMVMFEDHCSGLPSGRIQVAEWKVHGVRETGMVRRHTKAWPLCSNLWSNISARADPEQPCFSYVRLEAAKDACLADAECHGFSFSVAAIDGGHGSGCYKTDCDDHGSVGLAYGPYGYWEKKREPPPRPAAPAEL